MKPASLALIMMLMLFLVPALSPACNECHSKNPKMVAMHRELGFKDCFTCHNLSGKKTREELMKQRQEDRLCIRCHNKQ